MVLRKPYRFLIKHFRFIHFILALMSTYLLTRTNNLINFFNEYLSNTETVIGTGTSDEYFSILMILLSLGVFIGSIIILIIMKMKDKPIKFYIISIVAYLFIVVIYLYDNSIIEQMELRTLDIRTIKLASDFTLMCFLVQTFSTIILFIRAIGFNIKKFNFDEDLQFDIDEKDNEEFEFNVDIDKNRIQRNFKKNLRDLKYNYHENKFIINTALLVVALVIGIVIFLNVTVYHKVYKQNNVVKTTEYSYIIKNSYVVDSNYRNKKITNNSLVVVKFLIRNNTTFKKKFEPARVLLHIGKIKYNPTEDYKNDVLDFGKVYNDENITETYKEYILVFEIPTKYKNKKMTLSYTDAASGTFNTRLSISKLKKSENKKVSLNDNMEINNEIINNVKFSISSYEINNKFKATYNFCETKTYCYDAYEYVVPTLTDNYNKTILKINSTFDLNKQKLSNISDLSDLIESYGSIKYKLNGEEKEMNTQIKEVIPTKSKKQGVYYFEVYDEIQNASEISLIITIRNNKYEYKIKG